MSPLTQTKVLIAGGSISGLTLANILERIGIDYLVLEKYDTIAPDLGASIGIFANGFRILDQLGCYDAINALIEGADSFESLGMRNEHGQLISNVMKASQHLQQRLAYAPVFVDRQMLIRILYDNLRDRTKVLTAKGVEQVEHVPGGVRVQTKGGDIFSGEILVGADGIHSTVRREMWRLADQTHPGHFPLSDRTEAATNYCCIFGISMPNEKFPKFSSQQVMGRGYSYLVATGPNHRIYWFLFKKLPNTVHGLYEKIPRYTEAERDGLAAEHAKDALNEQLCFGELYSTRTTATLQALPEVVFSKWHFGRITTIGDAAHKFNPIGGQGGNTAIEDAAVLSNCLIKLAKPGSKDFEFSDANVTDAFKHMESLRQERVRVLMRISHGLQSMQAMENFAMRVIAKYIIPWSDKDSVLELLSSSVRPAAKLDMIAVPKRNHMDLYYDERCTKPIESKIPQFMVQSGLLTLSGLSLVVIPYSKDRVMPGKSLRLLPELFSGVEPINAILQYVFPDFEDSTSSSNAICTLQSFYLLTVVTSICLIWFIEGNRHNNRGSRIFRSFIFLGLMHFHSICFIIPLSFLLHVWLNGRPQSTVGRCIPETLAKALTSLVMICYALPTLLLLLSATWTTYRPNLDVAWLFAASGLGLLLPYLVSILSKRTRKALDFDVYSIRDVSHLICAYKLAFAISLVHHTSSLLLVLSANSHPEFSVTRFQLPHRILREISPQFDQRDTSASLKLDLFCASVSVVLYGVYYVYELRAKGLITTKQAITNAGSFLVAQPICGPGAAIVGLWWWREVRLSSARHFEAMSEFK